MVITTWTTGASSVTIVKGQLGKKKKQLKKQKKCLLETLFDKVLNTMLSKTNITEASIFHEITYLIIKTTFNNDSYFFHMPFSSPCQKK